MGLKIKDLFESAGFPKGVISVIIGGSDVGQELVSSDIDKIVITGSVEAGNDVMKRAGIKPALLELGGNDAAIVCEDANLSQAVPAICWGAIYNAGQACNGIKRVYVHKKIAREFTNQVAAYIKQLKRERDYGPIISENARSIIFSRVQDAIRLGAKVILGGQVDNAPGFWLDPIVLVFNNDELELISKETFGPILPIRIIDSEQDGIKLANSTCYGLGANIWTRDIKKGRQIAAQIEAKMVCINEALFGLPGGEYWGGWKNSGLGTTENRLMSFQKRKIVIANSSNAPRSWWLLPK